MGRVSRRILLGGVLGWALASGCLSPTLPLPPPDAPNMEASTTEGMVILSGRIPQPSARVHAINWTQIEANDPRAIGGDMADRLGDYRLEIRGDEGDECMLYYEYSGEESQDRFFEISLP